VGWWQEALRPAIRVITTWVGLLDLGPVRALVDDGLTDGSCPHEERVTQMHEAVGPVRAQPRDQVETLLEELVGKGSRDGAPVATERATEPLDQERNRTAVIDRSWSQAARQHIPLVLDRHVEWQATEPAHRGRARAASPAQTRC
jgi:hypothetical protein